MKIMKTKLLTIVLCALSLCACHKGEPSPTVIKRHRNDYMATKDGGRLVVLPPLSGDGISHAFDIPKVRGKPGIEPTPPGSRLEQQAWQKHLAAQQK